MNTELLQQLLGMLEGAGEGSFWLIVIYLVYPYFRVVLMVGFFGSLAFFVYRMWLTSMYCTTVVERIRAKSTDYAVVGDTAPYLRKTRQFVDRWLNDKLGE